MRGCKAMALLMVLGAGPVLAAEDVPVAVMELASKGGVSQEQMDSLGDLLANSIRDLGGFRVLGKGDIRTALNFEEQKQLLGCTEAGCAAEIGGALGVRWVVVGNVSQFGETFLLNLKLMDVANIKIEKGLSRKVEGGQAQLIDALAASAQELMGPLREAAAATEAKTPDPAAQSSATATVEPAGSPPEPAVDSIPGTGAGLERPRSALNLWGHITMWSGVGMTALGFVAMGLAINEAKAYDNGEPDALAPARAYTGAMWVGLGTGVALMATGLTLWLLDDKEPPLAVGAGPTGAGGFGLSLAGRW